MLPVAVLCGGRGTRLRGITGDRVPKALVPVAGHPFIEWKLENLAAAGFRDVVLLVGHLGDQIRAHVGDGRGLGVSVRYHDDRDGPLGTGGALRSALSMLPPAFWVTYGDSLLDFDAAAAERRFESSPWLGLMTVLRDPAHPSNTLVAGELVVAYGKDPAPVGAEHIDYGMLILTRDAFATASGASAFDLERVIQPLAERRMLGAFAVDRAFHDIGTEEALRETERFVRQMPQS
jgi:NDP-sugar pyrophosphorylase family protein